MTGPPPPGQSQQGLHLPPARRRHFLIPGQARALELGLLPIIGWRLLLGRARAAGLDQPLLGWQQLQAAAAAYTKQAQRQLPWACLPLGILAKIAAPLQHQPQLPGQYQRQPPGKHQLM